MHEAELVRIYLWDDQANFISIDVPPDLIKILKGNLYSLEVSYNNLIIVRVNQIIVRVNHITKE